MLLKINIKLKFSLEVKLQPTFRDQNALLCTKALRIGFVGTRRGYLKYDDMTFLANQHQQEDYFLHIQVVAYHVKLYMMVPSQAYTMKFLSKKLYVLVLPKNDMIFFFISIKFDNSFPSHHILNLQENISLSNLQQIIICRV